MLSALQSTHSWFGLRTRATTVAVAVFCGLHLASPLHSQTGWQTSGNTVYVPSGTNVGVGATTPASQVDIKNGHLRLSRLGDSNGYVFENYGSGTALNVGYMTTSDSSWLGGSPIMSMLYTGNVGIGTTAPQYKLSVNGTIGTKEVIVTSTGWSDYVFRPDYRLPTLTEVSAYIQEYHHLPNIPSEKEVQQKGVSLGEMQAKLLAKVEELTLHMIQADEKNKELILHMLHVDQENRDLKERLARLEAHGTF